MEPIVLFNLFILLISFWVIMYTNRKYIYITLLNAKRFKLFELRDRLAVLAMRDRIDPESQTYLLLMDMINFFIKSTEDFRITKYIKSVIALERNPAIKEKIVKIEEIFNQNLDNVEVIQIYCDLFSTLESLIKPYKTMILLISRICIKIAKRFNMSDAYTNKIAGAEKSFESGMKSIQRKTRILESVVPKAA